MPRQSRATNEAGPASSPPERAATRWLLLIHQIPPKPDYLRVKIGRRLQRIGAIPIKNSVYALPARPESYEDFQWIVREIAESGGDAFISEAVLGDGLTNEAVREKFDGSRNADYAEILVDAKALLKATRATAKARRGAASQKLDARRPLEQELAKLRRRYEAASAIDFFGASGQEVTAAALAEIQDSLRQNSTGVPDRTTDSPHDGATWVTRRDVHVDRIASAWLIRRFIDRHPTFRFVDPVRYAHRDGELRFDMFEAEYTHMGDACTFETLVSTFVPEDAALQEIAEVVHDVDCKDAKFRREEAPGLARVVAGVVARWAKDEERTTRGAELFESLYAAFGGTHRHPLTT
ncbi:MAG: chromate resistance protein ChrB domain-containing protein [bacterium]